MSPEQPSSAPQWGAPQGGAPGYGHPVKPSNGLGIAALILGILGLLTSFIFVGGFLGLVAVILGFIARGKVKRGEATNGGAALTGIITGFLAMLVVLVFVVFIGVILSKGDFGSYTECVSAANNDQAKVEKCAEDFTNSFTH
jgi:hypothetical protein